ncbi:MAG: pilus assembly protein PilM [Actinomycetota bacterium]|nr:pilus assembly protein PilM [Actinomycetota bacterium]
MSKGQRKRDHIVSIDLGGRTTKAVYLQRKGDRFALLSYAILDAPISDKAISVDLLADHLKNVSRMLGNGKAKPVTLAVGVTESLFRQIEVPLMPVDDLRMMLKFNSKTYLQQDLADHVFDCCYVIPGAPGADKAAVPNPQKQRIMVGAARKTVIDDLAAAVKAAGMIPDQVVPGLIGPVNAFELAQPEAFRSETLALVDLGFKNSFITILDRGEIKLNRVVAIGGDRLTSGLAEAMNISYVEAENIKIGMPTEVQPNLETILAPLGRELRASIDFFEHQNDKAVSQIYISGGSARSELIMQALQAELMVPCKTWNPAGFLQLDPQKAGELEQVTPQLTVALGAATSAF